jgi:hypothetical protein
MSKLGNLGHFFLAVGKVAPVILAMNPATAAIAAPVQAAIQEAEAIHGAGTGSEKLAHVVATAQQAATVANTAAGKVVVDPAAIQEAVANAVATIIAATKLHPQAA